MKSNKTGITIISIMIMIAVLLLISTIATVAVNTVIQNTFEKDYISEYNLVKAATSDYVMRNSGIVDFDSTEINMANINARYLSQFEPADITSNKIACYVINLEKIGVYNASYGTRKNGDNNDVYVLSKNTGTVYYKKGVESKGEIYYRPDGY